MKRAIIVLGLLTIGALAVVAVVGYFLGWFAAWLGGQPGAAAPGGGADALRVEVVRPVRRTVVQPAQVEPWERVEVIAKIPGYLKNFGQDMDGKPIDTGGRIKPGQTLAVLSVPELDAELSVKKATLQQTRDAVTAATEQQRVAETDREKFQADLEFRDAELKRHQRLYKEGSIQIDLLEEKTNQHKAAKAALSNAIARIGLAAAELHVAEARVAVADHDRQRVADLFAYATLTAPAAEEGALYFVVRRWADPGAYVQPSTGAMRNAILSLVRADRVRVVTDQLPELDTPYVEVGDQGTFEASALPGRPFAGKVSRLSPALEMPSRTMRVEMDVANPGGKPLFPGMYGTLRLHLGERKGVWLLPPTCIRKDPSEAFVFVVADGKIEKTPVKLGAADGRNIEVLSGVTAETNVVRQAYGDLRAGAAATIIGAKK